MSTPDASIEADALTALLRHFDWSPRSKVPGRFEIWVTHSSGDEGEDNEILVPLDPTRGDFPGLLDRARRRVLSHYGKSAYDLLGMLQAQASAALDETQWLKETALPPGMIGWQDGEDLYVSARDQLSAVVRSSRQPRRYHGSANWYLSRTFLESCYMGQTDIGSFIISAHIPSRTRFHVSRRSERVRIAEPNNSETISGRAIVDNFETALNAVVESLAIFKREAKLEVFSDAVSEGVSAELVRALSKFTQNSESAVRIDRSRQSPDDPPPRLVEISFDPTVSPVLDRAANALVLDPEPTGVTLQGQVSVLSREITNDVLARVIRLNVEGAAGINKVRVPLDADQYELAMEAHRHEKSLRVTGRLERENKLWWLYNAGDVGIVEPIFPDRLGTVQLSLDDLEEE